MGERRRTQVADDLLHHVFEHAPAVLRVEEGEELLLVEQLVGRRVVGLEPAVFEALQDLLSCKAEWNRFRSLGLMF